MIRCRRCLLPETFPGVCLDEDHVCAWCREQDQRNGQETGWLDLRGRFEALAASVRGRGDHDVLMSYSGGKDSTAALAWLRRTTGLRILAVTYDNGFLPERTFANIRAVVEALDVDSLIVKPRFPVLKQIFAHCLDHAIFPPQTLQRATMLCTACIAVVKFGNLRLAVDRKIPMVAYGWSPGQIPAASAVMKHQPDTVRLMQTVVAGPLANLAGRALDPYFLSERHFRDPADFPYNVAPLCFQPYAEQEILGQISSLGWMPPGNTDENSTNCLLNTLAVRRHCARYHFHPYASEIASLIRRGYLTREEGRRKLTVPQRPEVEAWVAARLGLDSSGCGDTARPAQTEAGGVRR